MMVDKMLAQMERDVAEARRVYVRAADRKRQDPNAAFRAWEIYAHLLHRHREEVRKNG